MNDIILFGAGGCAKEVANSIMLDSINCKIILFDNVSTEVCNVVENNFLLLRSYADLKVLDSGIIVCVGNPHRKIVSDKIKELNMHEVGYISNSCTIGHFNNIHDTAVVLQGATITIDATIGRSTLVNKSVLISHGVKIGDYVEISPNATLLGDCEVGDSTQIGANATILPRVKIGKHCIIGAGAVVTSDIKDYSTAVGVPAKVLSKN
ncbi:acetyltransferase [Vibrio sp. ECSMB14106]|uniref:acetyltransferase n=1 Tax=Vibrio sp. ECSMB14106 TaxID=1638949 RepID=UPI00069698CB|nr:acetyltransferase [Vibrio sp. ECSMB14106]